MGCNLSLWICAIYIYFWRFWMFVLRSYWQTLDSNRDSIKWSIPSWSFREDWFNWQLGLPAKRRASTSSKVAWRYMNWLTLYPPKLNQAKQYQFHLPVSEVFGCPWDMKFQANWQPKRCRNVVILVMNLCCVRGPLGLNASIVGISAWKKQRLYNNLFRTTRV